MLVVPVQPVRVRLVRERGGHVLQWQPVQTRVVLDPDLGRDADEVLVRHGQQVQIEQGVDVGAQEQPLVTSLVWAPL